MNKWVRPPIWLKMYYPSQMIWDIPVTANNNNTVYITFDDGPHPKATPFVLEQLAFYNASATFFCVGDNARKYPDIYRQLLQNGHKTGNHTFNHLNGWRTDNLTYFDNIGQAAMLIDSTLFRPPYGLIKPSQARKLLNEPLQWHICMWDILSWDFDKGTSKEQCLDNVVRNIRPGSIIIFHDSEKAWESMSYALPKTLQYCKQKNWSVSSLPY